MSVLFQEFQRAAKKSPDKIAIISEDKHFSYKQLLQLCNARANQLLALSPNALPRVALLTEQAINTASLSLAVAKLTTTCVPTNPQLTKTQLIDGWLATDVNLVVYEADFSAKIQQCKTYPEASHFKFVAIEELTSMVDNLNDIAINTNQADTNIVDDFIITLSSGSTGKPKPIALSQHCKLSRAQQSCALYDIYPEDIILCASPFFHSLGQRLFFVPLLQGCTLIQLKQFTPQSWLAAVDTHKVSKVISVSSHLYALKEVLLANTKQLQSLKTIVTSSAPIDNHFKEQLFKAIGCDFHEMYGATEVATATNLFPKFSKEKHTTVGSACPNVSIKILAEDKTTLPVNTIGEIAVKSPLAFNGYYHQDLLTKASFQDEYFLTGDLGQLADDGFLTYVGRKKDIIISGGINIYPKDIESSLATHHSIKEVAVIGVDDKFLGEVILAVCVIHKSKETDEETRQAELKNSEKALRRIANKTLAPFQRPIQYFFEDALPLTASGKTSKLILRDHYNQLNVDWSAPLRAMLFR